MLTALIQPVVDEINDPTYVGQAQAQALLRPVFEFATAMQKQAAEHRSNLLTAESDPEHYRDVRGENEKMHQTIDAMDADAKILITTARRMVLHCDQIARYGSGVVVWAQAQDDAKAAADLATGTTQ